MLGPLERHRFQQLVLPHIDSAFNLARWLLRNRTEAEDVVLEAASRAFRSFNGLAGTNAKARVLGLVRNCCYDWLQTHPSFDLTSSFDQKSNQFRAFTLETLTTQRGKRRELIAVLESLPTQQLEIFVLREFERCSYKEIAEITGHSVGMVISTLFSARAQLLEAIDARA